MTIRSLQRIKSCLAPKLLQDTRESATGRDSLYSTPGRSYSRRAMESVTIDRIVDAADVSKGSFYNHFGDRQSLVGAVVEAMEADLEQIISTANTAIADPPGGSCE